MSKTDNEEFKKGMEEATKKLIDIQFERMKVASAFLQAKAVEEAPVETGALRGAMESKVKLLKTTIVGVVGNSLIYAPYVHQGTGEYAVDGGGRQTPWRYKHAKFGWLTTKGQRPQPFLKNAMEKNKESIIMILRGED